MRGLSDVAIAMSASRPAISPIGKRFPLSRSPPQPKTSTIFRSVSSPHRLEEPLERVGRVRVVHEDRIRLARLDRLQAARHADAREARAAAIVGSGNRQGEAGRGRGETDSRR